MIDLDPRRHMTTKWSSEKLSLHLNQCSVLLFGLLCLSAMSEAILLYTTVVVFPLPPAVKKTSGQNAPCSTSLTLSSLDLHFSSSL